MQKGLGLLALVAALGLVVAVASGQGVVYLNGVAYAWPAIQGSADDILTADDAVGTLDWATPPSSEGLWSGCIVLSTVACPVDWTRLPGPDARFLRGDATEGGTGGADTHEHGFTGILSASGVTVTGSAASSGWGVSGSTASTDVSHSHPDGNTSNSFYLPGGPGAQALTSYSVDSNNPSHSHAVGTLGGSSHSHGNGSLAGGSHGHAVGTFDDATASSIPAYYHLIVCEKD